MSEVGAPGDPPTGTDRSADDTDTGWGEVPGPGQDDRDEWLLGERPPHWDADH